MKMLQVLKRHPLRLGRLVLKSRSQSSAASSKLVDVTVNDTTGIATVTMQKPPVNSLSLELLQELSSAFQKLEEDRSRGMILTSSLPTVFCAGLDIMEIYKKDREKQNIFWTMFQETWLNLYSSSYPTVAVINGHSPAGGCLLALTCEYRVMVGPKYNIGLNETKLGLVPPKWVSEMMLRAIGQRQTELALVNGIMFTAEEAIQVGLVDKLAVDKADAMACADEFLVAARKIPAAARELTKQSLRIDIIDWLHQNRDEDRDTFLDHVNKPEQQSIIHNYLELLSKRKTK